MTHPKGQALSLLNTLQKQLFQLRQATSHRRYINELLTEVAEGRLSLDPVTQQQMVTYLNAIRAELSLMDYAPSRVVVRDTLTDDWGSVPEPLRAAYHRLYETIYGTRALMQTDNPRAKAPRQVVTNDGHTRKIGPTTAAPKSATASRRNVILDHAAWEFKRGIDRRLKDVTALIRDFNSTRSRPAATSAAERQCTHKPCSRLLSPTWEFCPWCGRHQERNQ